MNITILGILLVAAILIIWVVLLYNKLVARRNGVHEAWSGIDISLKKRYDLVPNLVETVKGYAKHEQELLEKLTSYRTASVNATTTEQKAEAATGLSRALGSLFAVAENYPDLKANTNFLELQSELSNIEQNLESARRYYNGVVRENNNLVESFPANILAGMFGFRKVDFLT
ncbi:MAG: LemA family protein, partial [Chitinophagaceae bacterium]|nr:LemA family protein [Chitinophagaceae bacterium]